MRINIAGTVRGTMGYSQFARNLIVGLHDIGADITVQPIIFDHQNIDHGQADRVCMELTKRPKQNIDINIINMIPRLFEPYMRTGSLNIGFTMFEATHIPELWVKQCNKMDAILVPSTWNKQVFEASGVRVPIRVVAPGIGKEYTAEPKVKPEQKYTFYSIFQWTERKNPHGLIKAYWVAFSGNDNVRLIIKTHYNKYSLEENNIILEEVKQLKQKVVLKHYPEVVFVFDKLTSEQILDIHQNNNCFVSPHRGEGYGMGLMEAMTQGNPAIATNYSGNIDFMNTNNSYLIDYHLTPISNMINPWYDATMYWAEPDLKGFIEHMRYVYENQNQAADVGLTARKQILENLDARHCAEHLLKTLTEIKKDLNNG